jgi:carbon storage regulator
MLVLSRRKNETIIIDGRIKLTVIEIRGNQIRLGIEAPQDVRIARAELVASGAIPALEPASASIAEAFSIA